MTARFDLSLLPKSPDLSIELPLWDAGIKCIAGVDEAGRGALAGPVSAAALILPPESSLTISLSGLRDSKELTPLARAYWARLLQEVAVSWGVGFASHLEIDEVGIVPATRLAVQRALENLTVPPQHLLLDYLFLPDSPIPQTALIKGDARSLSIAAASILAKTTRDVFLGELDRQYPGYGLAAHKGYCTKAHLTALQRLGPSPIHRRSFAPLNSFTPLNRKNIISFREDQGDQ
jgi:ribonuclease HII